MRIEFNNLYSKIPLINNQKQLNFGKQLVKEDTFEKSSNVSFGSSAFWDDPDDLSREIKEEIAMSIYLKKVSEKDFRKRLISIKDKNVPLEKLNFIPNSQSESINYINNIFKQAGIRNLGNLEIFLKHFTSNPNTPKIFEGQNVEAVKIYGILDKKSDLSKFPELALTIYQEQANRAKPKFDILNDFFVAIKAFGIEQESDIDEKFNYLKPKFNNFETSTDKLNAIDYIINTLDDKTQMLDEIIKKSPDISDLDSFDIYLEISDIVNYLYEKNDGRNLENLPFFIDTALSAGKIKYPKKAEELFGSFSDIGNKIEFYTLLKECNISVNEFNNLAKPNIISDLSLLDILIYRQTIIDEMQTIGETNNQKVEEVYKNLYPILTAVYTRGDNQEDSESLNTLINVIDKYKIKKQNDFLNFYNKIYGKKERKLTIEKICELTDLFKFDDEINILETAKKLKITPKELLEKKKQHFEDREQEINNFLETTSCDALIGKSAFEIYKEYSYLINDVKPENIYESLELGVTSGLHEKNSEYTGAEFTKFANLFPSKKDTLSFIINNKIKFDTSDDSIKYRNACLDIIQSIHENESPENFLEKMQKISELGFLTKSKQSLSGFVSEMQSLGLLKEITSSVIDNEIPSVRVLNNFLKKYETHTNNHTNLIKHILTIPKNITFNQYTDLIEKINEKIKSYQVNTLIDNDNILNIDINKYFNKKSYSTRDINDLFCAVLGKENSDISFISMLNNSYTNEKKEYSSYDIAKEIANRIDFSDESYQNLSKELGLDRQSLGLDNNCSRNIYIKVIEKKLPQELINFVNSNEWIDFNNNEQQLPNMTLHAKLRLIDRFALSDNKGINNLNTEETQSLLKDILKSIYTKIPKQIKGQKENQRVIIQTEYNNQTIESVFNGSGELITAINL